MARKGQNLSDELREKIKADYAVCGNASEVAKKYGVAVSTVTKLRDDNKDEFEELRKDKRQELIDALWDNIVAAQELGFQIIRDAKEGKKEVPLGQISTYLGTLYDKRALMLGESTANTELTVKLQGELESWAN